MVIIGVVGQSFGQQSQQFDAVATSIVSANRIIQSGLAQGYRLQHVITHYPINGTEPNLIGGALFIYI